MLLFVYLNSCHRASNDWFCVFLKTSLHSCLFKKIFKQLMQLSFNVFPFSLNKNVQLKMNTFCLHCLFWNLFKPAHPRPLAQHLLPFQENYLSQKSTDTGKISYLYNLFRCLCQFRFLPITLNFCDWWFNPSMVQPK